METGGGGRSQGEGEMDNVKYNREDGGAEGRKVMRVNRDLKFSLLHVLSDPKPGSKSQP